MACWFPVGEDCPLSLVALKLGSQLIAGDKSSAIARGKLIRTLKNAYFLVDNKIIIKYSIGKGMLSWLIKIEILKGSEVRKWRSL